MGAEGGVALSQQSNGVQVGAPFREHAAGVMSRVRNSFAELLAALPEACARPQDLRRAMRINTKLAWQAHTIAHGGDPFLAAEHVPGAEGVNILLQAARAKGVSAEVLRRVEEAVAGFHALIQVHADSRQSLEMMLSGLTVRGRERADQQHRRAAFNANGYLFGVQANVQIKTDFLRLAPDSSRMMHLATLRGFMGLKRLRPNVPCLLANSLWANMEGEAWESERRPLVELTEEQRRAFGEGAIPEFCSPSMPPVRRLQRDDGSFDFELTAGDVGNAAQVNWMMGELRSRPVGRGAGEVGEPSVPVTSGAMALRLFTPCKQLIFDNFIHRDTFVAPCRPRLIVRSNLEHHDAGLPTLGHARSVLPALEEPEYLGTGPDVAAAAEVPRYSALVRSVFEKTGWDPSEFDVYRLRMQYPPVPTSMLMLYESEAAG